MPRGTNPALEIFLNLLYPWDEHNATLYKSVTWSFKLDTGEQKMANFATQSYDDLIRLIETRGARNGANTYVALGTQRMADVQKHSKDGYPKAVRQIANVVSFNSIYLDLDVKPDAYATTDDAFAALDDFVTKVGLPPATMEVLSGTGGAHIYWCTKEPMPVNAWTPLAAGLRDAALQYGLKFDPQVTVNAAGILRAPGTFNFKTNPPGQVTLIEDSSFQRYDYQQLVSALGAFVGPLTGVRLMPPQGLASGGGTFTQNFVEGVENAPPVAIEDVAVRCGVINDILATGGAGNSEPLWNLAVYLASFTIDPRDAAHKLSQGDSRYTQAETDKKLEEKINARVASASGWPQCASFSPLHPACQTCPLFAQGKSPLNFAMRPQVVQMIATSQLAAASNPHVDQLMPNNYWRNLNKHVETVVKNDKGEAFTIDVLGYPVLDAGIDPDSGDLVMRTSHSGVERWGNVAVQSNLQPVPAAQALAKGCGIFVVPSNHKTARDFLVAWMTKLQEAKRTILPASFGWTKDGKGFTFDDKTYQAAGATLAFRGSSADKRFGEEGDIKPWQEAMKLVYGNPPLEAVVASAFAAPLMELIGSTSVVLSVYSHLSGVGKTTAMQLAQAVWGNPRTGMSSLDDTQNSVMKKVADLKSLPVYWDELRTMEQMEKIVNLVFSITQGKAKARLTRDIQQQEAGAFTTMFVIASNYGLTDTVYANTEATEAGGLRVFEIEAEPLPKTKEIDDWKSRQMMLPLTANYGRAGAVFANFLATNRPLVEKVLAAVAGDLMKQFNFGSKERFWAMTMTTILVGAQLANHCGLTQFDITRLRAFMEESLMRQRSMLKTEAHTTMSDPDAVLSLLNDMRAELRGKNMIITDYIYYTTGGRPMPIKTIDADPSKLGDVWLQQGDVDGKVRVRLKPFNKWLREHNQHPGHVRKLLSKFYIVTQSKQRIGAGVAWLDALAKAGRSECLDLTPIPGAITAPGSSPD